MTIFILAKVAYKNQVKENNWLVSYLMWSHLVRKKRLTPLLTWKSCDIDFFIYIDESPETRAPRAGSLYRKSRCIKNCIRKAYLLSWQPYNVVGLLIFINCKWKHLIVWNFSSIFPMHCNPYIPTALKILILVT